MSKDEILLALENSFTAAKDFADKNSLESFYEMMGRYDYLNRVARNESFLTNEEYEDNVKRASDLKLEFNYKEYKLDYGKLLKKRAKEVGMEFSEAQLFQ